jgi:hypothetical protein
MKNLVILLTGLLVGFPWSGVRADKPEGVAAVFAANEFYRTCVKLEPQGLPSREEMKRLGPLMTRELRGMFEVARGEWRRGEGETRRRGDSDVLMGVGMGIASEGRRGDAETRRHGDGEGGGRGRGGVGLEGLTARQDGGGFGGFSWEGNLFASLSERPVSFYNVGFPVIQGDTATVPIHLEHHEKGRVTRWVDVLVLVRDRNAPRYGRSAKDWFVDDVFFNAPWPLEAGASLRSRLWLPMRTAGKVVAAAGG